MNHEHVCSKLDEIAHACIRFDPSVHIFTLGARRAGVAADCAATELDKPDTCAGLLQRNLNTAEVHSELHSRLGPLQGEPHTFFISKVNASGAANKGAATDRAIGAGKVADLPYA
jgi:hypothetical protein